MFLHLSLQLKITWGEYDDIFSENESTITVKWSYCWSHIFTFNAVTKFPHSPYSFMSYYTKNFIHGSGDVAFNEQLHLFHSNMLCS